MSLFEQYGSVVIIGICACVGYIIKKSLTFIDNKHIPLILGVLGLVISVVVSWGQVDAETVFSGLFSGLAATGVHNIIKNNKEG